MKSKHSISSPRNPRDSSTLPYPAPVSSVRFHWLTTRRAVGEHGRYKQVELDISELTSRLESRDVVTSPAPNKVQDVRRRAQETGAGPQGG